MFEIIIILLGITYLIIYYKVKRNSENCAKIIEVNQKYIFNNNVPKRLRITEEYKSKRKLESVNIHSRIIYAIYNNENNLSEKREVISKNRVMHEKYKKECEGIINKIIPKYPKKLTSKMYIYFEKKACKNLFVKPKLNFTIKYYGSYTSPKGRNHYSIQKKYNFDDMESIYNFYQQEVEKEELRKEFISFERKKMSDSLRYDVFRKDNNKCVMCGATAKDGVKLHIDHIKPVSKGGKTEFSNLQTLCERCNTGKSNKE